MGTKRPRNLPKWEPKLSKIMIIVFGIIIESVKPWKTKIENAEISHKIRTTTAESPGCPKIHQNMESKLPKIYRMFKYI